MNRRQRAMRFTESVATLKAGDFVSWPASRGNARGRVASVHTSSKVPGVAHSVTGTKESPAARVRLYAKSGKGWAPTETFVPMPTSKLTTIDALAEPASEAVSGSFDDIRSIVQDAIADRAEMFGATDAEIWVNDLGLDWVVYSVGWDGDLWLSAYTLDSAGVVTLGDPSEVQKVTMYVPEVEPVDGPSGDTITEARADRIEGRLLAAKGADAAGGRVYAVRIIAYGDSKNDRRYNEATMRAAVPLYEGAKAYDHHRTDEELRTSTVQGIVGTYRNVVAGVQGIEADLHLLPSASHVVELFDQSLANQQEGLAPLVGISHDVMATYRPVVSGGKKMMEATGIVSVNSADVVADPAAGGQATRMVAGGIDPTTPTTKGKSSMTYKQLLLLLRTAEGAARAALLAEHAHIIESAGFTADEAVRNAESLPVEPALDAKITEAIASAVAAGIASTAPAAAPVAPVAPTRTPEGAFPPPVLKALEGVTDNEMDKKRDAVFAMISGDYTTGYKSLKEAYVDVTGRQPKWSDMEDFNREIMRESAQLTREGAKVDFDSAMRSLESVSASTWGFILGDSITRRMVAEYSQPSLQTWRTVVSSVVPVNDFRTQRLDRMGGYGVLPGVNQGAPYQPLTSPGNEEITYALTKRGGTEDLTLETIANDDLRIVQRIPVKLGLAAAQTLYRFVWEFLSPTTNASIYDSTALYAAGHNNTFANALSNSALNTARKAMRKQTAYGDTQDILSLTPKTIVVPPDLEQLAFELVTSSVALPTAAPDGAAAGNVPNLHQGMNFVIVDYWSAQSTTGWVIVGDPSMAPTIELGFYQGQQDPAMFVQNDPTVGSLYNADKITYKVRHIYSGAVLDYRGMVRGNA